MGPKPFSAACPRNIFLAVSGLARYLCGTIDGSMLGARGCMSSRRPCAFCDRIQSVSTL
jgi:hypothetical protein